MSITVRDLMIPAQALPDNATIGDAVKAFAEKRVGGFPLVHNNEVVAYVSDGDIIHYILKNVKRENRRLSDIRAWYQVDCFNQYIEHVVEDEVFNCATRRVYTVEADMTVREAAEIMNRRNLKHVPVVEKYKLVGILSRSSLIHGLFKDYVDNPNAACIE